ncbi:DUF3987 domain-containing protein [Acinetobacter sp. DSM 11652]|uniref:DUF3987 domain-containing protein n=1 Tax=Acinetobacter sp. DSM 11652 TaxID=346222 RepID=UPI0008C2C861|nr:DUF3987 domain-containing protein [Acinetobacter sp. DSM 11652]SEM18933.1 Protein of unknown function [Acinetobacter sp. DSM 11652]
MENSNPNDKWNKPIPLKADVVLNPVPYPKKMLPEVIHLAAEAASEYVQVPYLLAMHCILSVISHIAQSCVDAPSLLDNEKGMPCSLFLIAEGGSGVRKSTCYNLIAKPLMEKEKVESQKFKALIKVTRKKSKKSENLLDDFELDIKDPTCFFSDITIEKLLSMYIEDGLDFASLSTDEASQFFEGFSMKSDSARSNLGAMTKIFDAGKCQKKRVGNNGINTSDGNAFDIRLTFNLLGQRIILQNALLNPVLRDQGFLPRFILSIPESLEGTRLHTVEFREKLRTAHLDPRLNNFWNRCMELSEKSKSNDGFVVLQLSKDAEDIDRDFYNECEMELLEGGAYEEIKSFANRAGEISRRVATNLAFFNNEDEISKAIMLAACEIVRYSLNEWLRYPYISDSTSSDSEKLIKYFKRHFLKLKNKDPKIDKFVIEKCVAQKSAPSNLRKLAAFDPALDELIRHKYARKFKMNERTYLTFNPYMFSES